MDTPNPIPTPGRIVHYWRGSLRDKPLPAIMIEWIPEKNQAIMCIFGHLGPSIRDDVPYGEPNDHHWWTWPERPKEGK